MYETMYETRTETSFSAPSAEQVFQFKYISTFYVLNIKKKIFPNFLTSVNYCKCYLQYGVCDGCKRSVIGQIRYGEYVDAPAVDTRHLLHTFHLSRWHKCDYERHVRHEFDTSALGESYESRAKIVHAWSRTFCGTRLVRFSYSALARCGPREQCRIGPIRFLAGWRKN